MTEFGVGTYTRNIVRALGRLDHANEYFLLGAPEKVAEIGSLPPNFHAVPLAEPERSLKSFWEFRVVVKRLDCDLVHIPHLFSVPRALPCPYVMTVHDMLEHLSRARQQTGFWGGLALPVHQAGAARRGAHFRGFEVYQNRDREAVWHSVGRIEVVYNAIDERFLHGHASEADRQLIAERYQVTYPFLLYAGRISPHKNVVRMIEAFSALKTELEKEQAFPDLKLIIIGDDVSGNPDLRRTVIRSGVQNDVRFLGLRAHRSAAHFLRCREDLRLPVAVRRLRPAAAGGDGPRHPGRDLKCLVAARGGRQRRGAGEPGKCF